MINFSFFERTEKTENENFKLHTTKKIEVNSKNCLKQIENGIELFHYINNYRFCNLFGVQVNGYDQTVKTQYFGENQD